KEGDLIDLGVQAAIVEKSGAWYSYNSERIGQGREAARLYLKEHGDTASTIEQKIFNHFGINPHTNSTSVGVGVNPAKKETQPVKTEEKAKLSNMTRGRKEG
ncbi:MAG TPA: hypothetical protein VJZ92_01635, partial [Thermodesulfobacteriota bacterium]|nr:hypothetical protein [Thermodesulfobacteriota bacterium]